MLFSVGGVAMFVIGGLSGVTHAVVPADYQQTDTYYIVAHFHYVIFGGAVFGICSRPRTTGGPRCSGSCCRKGSASSTSG